jgi:beta-N-acetylhexosaminidase
MVGRSAAILLLCLSFVTPPSLAQENVLDSLTLEQRVAQMFMVSLYGADLTDVGRDFLEEWQPGAVALFGSNAGTSEAVTDLTNAYQQTITDAGGLPLLIAVDQEGGLISHLTDGFTEFPAPLVITATGDTELAYAVGQAMAQELSAVGVNMNLAPVADLETNPSNPIIQRRAFGSDPNLTAPIVASVVRGLQENGVLATVKHFPGHGDTSSDSHTSLPVVDLSRERLDTVELVPFREAISEGVEVVMVAHIWFPALEPQENLPATLSHYVVTGLLREELGFDGLIMTDALAMDSIDTNYSIEDASVLAVQAGVDLLAFGTNAGLRTQAQSIQAVVDAARAGIIPEEQINASVQRILDVKARYGILNWQPLDAESAPERVHLEAHSQLVEDLFQAGVTVVYDDQDTIPFSDDRTIAMIYPATRAQIMRECGAYDANIHWVGVSDFPQDDEIAWSRSAAREADTAVVFTQNAADNPDQQRLVNAMPPEKTIVVALWSPYDWTTFPTISGYVATYSPLRPAVPAVCAVLFGEAPALGQLPISLLPDLPAGTHE